MRKSGTVVASAFGLLLAAAVQTASAKPVLLAPLPEKAEALVSPGQKAYLDLPLAERRRWLVDTNLYARLTNAGWRPRKVRLAWMGAVGPVSFCVSKGGKSVFEAKDLDASSIEVGNLEVGERYEWSVRDAQGESLGSFMTEDYAPRLMDVRKVPNFRDLGGRRGLDGRRVRQGLLFRSAGLNDNAVQTSPSSFRKGAPRLDGETRTYLTNSLAIRTDVDLRTAHECFGMDGSPLGPSVRWEHHSFEAYGALFSERGKSAFREAFKVFLARENYPIVFHCISGADRTGTLAAVLNGLLGVAEDDIYKDWETTAFHNTSGWFSHKRRGFDGLVRGFERYSGQTLNERMVAFVKSLGFTNADLARFRDIMLEPKPLLVVNKERPAGEPSFCSLRCGPGSCEDENWPKVLDALSQSPRPFDAIWFSTGVAYPPLDWHRAQSARCAKAAEDLKKIGMSAAVEIQMTIGHGDAMLTRQDCRAQAWPTWVGWNGKTCKHVSCPRGEGFRDYFARVASIYAEWKPECVWIDDDLRLENRAPSGGGKYEGCWCESCVAAFSRREGKNWTRETLLAAIEKGDKDLKRRWFALQEDNLAEFAGVVARAVAQVSPETRLGLEAALCANGVGKILKAMRDASGKPVRLRSGEGAYWDRNPHEQLEKAYRIAKATAGYGCFDLVDVFSPEIESCPRTFSCRTPQGAILEGFEQLATGANALSMFLADTRVGEDWAYYRDILFCRLGAAHGFLKGYAEANRGTLPCGFSVKGGEIPKELVACRGVPVVCGRAKSLGELPDVNAIPVSLGGSGWQAKGEHETSVMQAAAGPQLMDFARRADAVSGGKTPILFTRPVMAWVLPRVREDGELRTVALVNCSIDVQDPVSVHLRGVPADAKVTWVPLHGESAVLEFRRKGGDGVITLPAVGAWDCCYLKLTVDGKKP